MQSTNFQKHLRCYLQDFCYREVRRAGDLQPPWPKYTTKTPLGVSPRRSWPYGLGGLFRHARDFWRAIYQYHTHLLPPSARTRGLPPSISHLGPAPRWLLTPERKRSGTSSLNDPWFFFASLRRTRTRSWCFAVACYWLRFWRAMVTSPLLEKFAGTESEGYETSSSLFGIKHAF